MLEKSTVLSIAQIRLTPLQPGENTPGTFRFVISESGIFPLEELPKNDHEKAYGFEITPIGEWRQEDGTKWDGYEFVASLEDTGELSKFASKILASFGRCPEGEEVFSFLTLWRFNVTEMPSGEFRDEFSYLGMFGPEDITTY